MVIAIVPAAGKSERMGRPKLLLPLGPRLVIEHVLDALRDGGAARTLVVVAPHVPELARVARAAGADVVVPAEPPADMRASVVAALDHAERVPAGACPQGFLVAPADQPGVSAATVRAVIAAFRAARLNSAGGPRAPVVIPSYRGRRGHPVLFAWEHAAAVRSLPTGRGLNALVAELADEVIECHVEDPAALADLDTPADYERLKSAWAADC